MCLCLVNLWFSAFLQHNWFQHTFMSINRKGGRQGGKKTTHILFRVQSSIWLSEQEMGFKSKKRGDYTLVCTLYCRDCKTIIYVSQIQNLTYSSFATVMLAIFFSTYKKKWPVKLPNPLPLRRLRSFFWRSHRRRARSCGTAGESTCSWRGPRNL